MTCILDRARKVAWLDDGAGADLRPVPDMGKLEGVGTGWSDMTHGRKRTKATKRFWKKGGEVRWQVERVRCQGKTDMGKTYIYSGKTSEMITLFSFAKDSPKYNMLKDGVDSRMMSWRTWSILLFERWNDTGAFTSNTTESLLVWVLILCPIAPDVA